MLLTTLIIYFNLSVHKVINTVIQFYFSDLNKVTKKHITVLLISKDTLLEWSSTYRNIRSKRVLFICT